MPVGTQTGQPPTAPEVESQQQGDPAAQMAQMQMAKQQQQPQPDAGRDFVLTTFKKVSMDLAKIAQVVQTDAPQMMPILQKGVVALQMVEKEFSKSTQGQGQPVQGSEPPAAAAGGSDTLAM